MRKLEQGTGVGVVLHGMVGTKLAGLSLFTDFETLPSDRTYFTRIFARLTDQYTV